MKNVQAYILNISAIQSIEELQEMVDNDYLHTVESIALGNDAGGYTAPKWIMQGDIVFFYHAKTAKQHNRRLRNYINKNSEEFKNGYREDLLKYLDYCDRLYEKYGAKIFAVGKVCEDFLYYSKTGMEHPHFRSRIFAPIDNMVTLQFPLSVKQFENFLPIQQQKSVTPVLGNDFMKLKSLILRYNEVPYLENSMSLSVPLKDIKAGNWLKSANESGRKYLYEEQFRKYYVDYLLTCLSDDSKYYIELTCVKNGKISGRADNCILFNGKYLFVEVKLNMLIEDDICEQVKQYCNVDKFNISRKPITDGIYQRFVLVIDTNMICLYDIKDEDMLSEVERLDNVKSMYDIKRIKNTIITYMGL